VRCCRAEVCAETPPSCPAWRVSAVTRERVSCIPLVIVRKSRPGWDAVDVTEASEGRLMDYPSVQRSETAAQHLVRRVPSPGPKRRPPFSPASRPDSLPGRGDVIDDEGHLRSDPPDRLVRPATGTDGRRRHDRRSAPRSPGRGPGADRPATIRTPSPQSPSSMTPGGSGHAAAGPDRDPRRSTSRPPPAGRHLRDNEQARSAIESPPAWRLQHCLPGCWSV
jgi:hypothetical protein